MSKNNNFDIDAFVDDIKKDKVNSSAKKTYKKMIDEAINPSIDAIEYMEINLLEPAPESWNFFDPLSDDKMLELMDSIKEHGLQHPIVVWEKSDKNKYIILSGHNRYTAYNNLYKLSNDEKYERIPAKIYKHDEITNFDAQNIIIDTNWVQRDLSRKEKTKSIVKKYAQLQQNKKNNNIYYDEFEKMAKTYLNMSVRNIRRYRKIAELIPDFQQKVFDGKLSITSGEKLSTLDLDEQYKLHDLYNERLTNDIIKQINKYMSFDEIQELIEDSLKEPEDNLEPYVELTIRLPENEEKQFIKMFDKWKKENMINANYFK